MPPRGTANGAAGVPTVSRATLPYAGFPEAVTPRVGDLVAVGENISGHDIAAAPLCHWIKGVPKARPDGYLEVDGHAVTSFPGLTSAAEAKADVMVCVLDTDLPVAQVLGVRSAEQG
jgi:hypothetical protein